MSRRKMRAIRVLIANGKNDFTEVFKNLANLILKIILLDHQNNHVERLCVDGNAANSFNILHGKNDFAEVKFCWIQI